MYNNKKKIPWKLNLKTVDSGGSEQGKKMKFEARARFRVIT